MGGALDGRLDRWGFIQGALSPFLAFASSQRTLCPLASSRAPIFGLPLALQTVYPRLILYS